LASVAAMTAAGVRLSLDDFSSADRSLESLRSSPVSFVKVDRSLVRGIGENSSDDEAVRTIVSMAHRFGRIAVAEGVETRRQAQWLLHLGCDYGQGYLFAYPAPAGHIAEMVLGRGSADSSPGATPPAVGAQACDTSDDSARLDRLDRALPQRPTRR
jgi:EAL domain-containing protein (putative c-di-GMP-specific phosphodiesterase class I)